MTCRDAAPVSAGSQATSRPSRRETCSRRCTSLTGRSSPPRTVIRAEGDPSPRIDDTERIAPGFAAAVHLAIPDTSDPCRLSTEISGLGIIEDGTGIDAGGRRDAEIENRDTIIGNWLEAIRVGPDGAVADGVLASPDAETPTIVGRTSFVAGMFALTVGNDGPVRSTGAVPSAVNAHSGTIISRGEASAIPPAARSTGPPPASGSPGSATRPSGSRTTASPAAPSPSTAFPTFPGRSTLRDDGNSRVFAECSAGENMLLGDLSGGKTLLDLIYVPSILHPASGADTLAPEVPDTLDLGGFDDRGGAILV
jgi:hypothetical protein